MSQRILVVEDQEDLRAILRDFLSASGYTVIEAADGAESVAKAASERPDLVLMDIQLPVLDGYDATRQIKALSAEGRLSSIILSILPILLFTGLLILNPVFLRPLFTTTMWLMLMGGSVVLMIFGVFWLKKITEIKV